MTSIEECKKESVYFTTSDVIHDEKEESTESPIAHQDGIRNVKLSEDNDSVLLFHEEYDKLEEVESPAADPAFHHECIALQFERAEHLESLNTGEQQCQTDCAFTPKSDKKPKLLTRLQLEDDEGIVSKHATYFPTKIRRKDSVHCEANSDNYYDMSSFPRGTLTLLNVQDFRKSSGMSELPRYGTDRDADGLCALFLDLGFIVERYDNPTKKIILSAIEIAASQSKLSCCACAVLSHGEKGMVYATDHEIPIRQITQLFRKRHLAGKPKLFIFQACQGADYMEAVDAVDSPLEKESDLSLPCEADFLYAYSTVPGYFSWRNSRQGSWFIQALCSVFRENANTMDVYRLFTRVNDNISRRRSNTKDASTDDKRQIASIVSQMRKEFFLFPPYGRLPLIKSFESYTHN